LIRNGSVWKTPPTNVPPPVIAPRCQGLPRPVYSPVSDSASEKPMLTAAPIAVARPAKKAMCESCVESATAKIGASVESEPSISPISAGWTRERRKACSSSVKRGSLAALASTPYRVPGQGVANPGREPVLHKPTVVRLRSARPKARNAGGTDG